MTMTTSTMPAPIHAAISKDCKGRHRHNHPSVGRSLSGSTRLRQLFLLLSFVWVILHNCQNAASTNNNNHNVWILGGVQGYCSVRNAQGQRLTLSKLHSRGQVLYNPSTDTLTCLKPQSCRNFQISDCTAVYCRDKQACQGVTLVGRRRTQDPGPSSLTGTKTSVACWGPAACQQATLVEVQEVSCGTGYSDSCVQSNIELTMTSALATLDASSSSKTTTSSSNNATDAGGVNGQVLCYGPNACNGAATTVAGGSAWKQPKQTPIQGISPSSQTVTSSSTLIASASSDNGSSNSIPWMVVHVGRQGTIRCAASAQMSSSTATGQIAPACKNLKVLVPNLSRACILEPAGTRLASTACAVVCEGPRDCDAESIHFEIRA